MYKIVIALAIEMVYAPSSTPTSSSSKIEVQLVKDFIRLTPVYIDGQRNFEKIEK
ncbi:hypothetical protein Syun_017169 [Stephania yunnanensis]|uniref:Uncharacterized protein n=1 Tax=Stephania yunnanensis TaxID=152371 RepID=A0AAP0J8S0_9MAGN